MPLLPRFGKKHDLDEPIVEAGWTGRLHAIGNLIDGYETALKDVAIITTDREGWIAALGFRTGIYRAGWGLISLPIKAAPDEAAPLELPFLLSWRTSRSASPLTIPWRHQLRAIGSLLDQAPGPVRNACVLEVGGGYLIQAHVLFPAAEDLGWVLTSREVAAPDLAAVVAELPAAALVQVAQPWRFRPT